jgi:hypothetical protein
MTNNEYLTVKDISRECKLTTRYIRKMITQLAEEKNHYLIHKDQNNKWAVHRLLLPKFQPKKKRTEKWYALSIDPIQNYSERDIDEVMKFISTNMADENLEIHYTVEQKKANGRNHIHCYINCKQKKKLIESVRLGFSQVSYHQQDIFDLEGWKNYITKDGATIKTIKN